jgi:hypothetical protein
MFSKSKYQVVDTMNMIQVFSEQDSHVALGSLPAVSFQTPAGYVQKRLGQTD